MSDTPCTSRSSSIGSHLSIEMKSIDTELAKIDEQIKLLKTKRQKLIDKKHNLEKQINLRSTPTISSLSAVNKWETNVFPWQTRALNMLSDVFRLTEYRMLQLSAVNAIMSGEDTILVMSTGGGKSLCYQLPALLLNGITLVVAPLISLIEDQMIALQKLGIDAATLNQSTSKDEFARIKTAMIDEKSRLRILFVTPEKLAKSKLLMNRLEKCYELNRLKLIAIDEVHCCSQWGHDFRPDYKFLNVLKRQFSRVPILGLTATAPPTVLDDVKNILGIKHAIVFRAAFNRPNLYYEVRRKPEIGAELVDDIYSLITKRFARQCGIIYCFTRKESEQLAETLRTRGIKATCYHAQMDSVDRTRAHQSWLDETCQVIVATVAFGMGIDKPNVRFVIHHSLAKSLENYYQESGRAGRDGADAVCIVYYRLQDLFRQSTMICTEQTGLANLYAMLAYCIQQTECRRKSLAEHFSESWNTMWCNRKCDICEDGRMITNGWLPTRNEIDVTRIWRSMIEIINDARNNGDGAQGKVTGAKLVELCGRTIGKMEHIGGIKLTRAHLDDIVANLLLEGYLHEDFHFTPYSIISYVIVGPKTTAFIDDETHVVRVAITQSIVDDGAKGSSKKRKIDTSNSCIYVD